MTATSYDLHARTGHTAGNGSLMRTAPVALPYLDDPVALVEAARKVGALTHYDPHAQEACVLWSLAIRHAILHAEFDVRAGLDYLDDEGVDVLAERLDEAEQSEPGRFTAQRLGRRRPPSGVVRDRPHARPRPRARRAATSSTASPPPSGSVTTPTPSPPSPARCSVPAGALRLSRPSGAGSRHGYPGLRGERLVELAHLAANKGPGVYDWPLADHIDYSIYGSAKTLVQHPYDDGVWLADASALDDLPDHITAVVSLCLLGREQVPPDIEHVGYRLIDHADPAVNPNLDFMLADAARTIAALRDEGHQVVFCTASPPRAGRRPSRVAYAMLRGADAPRRSTRSAPCCRLPGPNAGFRAALKRLEKSGIQA